MPDRPVLIGGPLDGATIAPGPRPAFIYCVELPTMNREYRAKAFSEPGRERHLYRTFEGGQNFIYAGDTHRRCDGCQGYPTDRTRCPFCGHAGARR